MLGVLLAGSNVTFYWAVERLGVGPGATIQFLAPIFVLVWMVVAQHRKVPAAVWVAAVVAVTGVFFITEAWNLEGGDWVGVGWGIGIASIIPCTTQEEEFLGRTYSSIMVPL